MTEHLNQAGKDLAELTEALEKPNTPAGVIARVVISIGVLLIRKNTDYGCSAWDNPILVPNIDPLRGLFVRMSDKVARIARLAFAPNLIPESLADTVRDLAGYCILWLAYPLYQELIQQSREKIQKLDTLKAEEFLG